MCPWGAQIPEVGMSRDVKDICFTHSSHPVIMRLIRFNCSSLTYLPGILECENITAWVKVVGCKVSLLGAEGKFSILT